MPKKPNILHQEIVARSQLFRVEQLSLRFANGEERVFERLQGGNRRAVMIAAMQDSNTVLLVREYAAGTDRYELGLPKGLVEENEDLAAAANRELKEEVGFGAQQIEHITDMTIAPGYIKAHTAFMLAQDLYPERLEGDEPEPLEVIPWHLDKLEELLQRDDFTEARSIAALFWIKNLLNI